jgi:CTP:molybdopterin cytidylyltransferase MocA
VILLLAAGASSRMRGADKLMEPVQGEPLIRRQARAALASGARVVVTLPPDRPARQAALTGLGVNCVTVADPARGMAASLVAGLAAVPRGAAVIVLLADLPEITEADLRRLILAHAEAPEAILRAAAADGTPGHPVLFPSALRDELERLDGDGGARPILAAHGARVRLLPLAGRRAVTDLDTPEDWAAWRAAGGG